MKTKFKRIDVKDLVVGQEYYIICGIWRVKAIYTHSDYTFTGRTYYNFTIGTLDNFENQFNIYSTKSNLRIYKEM